MITYPKCKINLGLNVVARRPDGYHEISTLFYPVALTDILEIVPADATTLTVHGIDIDCPMEQNLVTRAYRMLEAEFNLPPVEIHLYKNIPHGAGLGGGSSDAAATLTLLNGMFRLGLSPDQLAPRAAKLGADCAFFVYDAPMFATGIGEILTPCTRSLAGYTLVMAKPPVGVSTREAYAGVTPHTPPRSVADIVALPVEQWNGLLVNDFEPSVFRTHPQLAAIKQALLDAGAAYAAMTGSGSTIYGIFDSDKQADAAARNVTDCDTFVIPLT